MSAYLFGSLVCSSVYTNEGRRSKARKKKLQRAYFKCSLSNVESVLRSRVMARCEGVDCYLATRT
jgi:hypothetical protein